MIGQFHQVDVGASCRQRRDTRSGHLARQRLAPAAAGHHDNAGRIHGHGLLKGD
ncbi:hypothetical protein [Thauera humireducens]|uniref:hypothetical protein n=1 Tax=Thauera humireducens TaxID=1134435 RepID=UPI00311E8D6E